MERIRTKWDAVYSPWITKILAAIIAFIGTYKLTEVGPLSPTAGIIASAIAALFCIWNPGGTAIIYVIVFFLSVMHINSVMVGLIFIVMIIYCMMGYASVSSLILTVAIIMSPLPESVYWGAFVVSIYFIYRCRETSLAVIYPIITSLMLITFAKFGTGNILYPGEFTFGKSSATDIDSFISSISFDADSQLLMPNMGLIVELTVFILLAAVIIWLVFRNKWLRTKIKSLDICEAVMFAIAIIIIILLDILTKSTMGLVTGTSYGLMIFSVIIGFVVTRPFATDKVAQTLISKRTLKDRENAALNFIAVKPKNEWDTPYVNENIKQTIKNLDKKNLKGILIRKDSDVNAIHIVDLLAKVHEAKIIKIDHDIFDKLYGEKREIYFKKIFEDAKAQAPTIVCFNDADKFFYKVDEKSGEYVKRYHRIYMAAIEEAKEYEGVNFAFVVEDAELLDDKLNEESIITSRIDYLNAENTIPENISHEISAEEEKKINKKTNRASVIAVILSVLVFGGLLYYLFVYEDQKYDISETTPVETTVIDYVYTEEDISDVNDQVADIMDSSDATFFYIEDQGYGAFAVYQTDEATFTEMSPAKKGTVLKKICKATEALFNRSYDNMPAIPLSDANNTNNAFNGHLKMGNGAEQLDAEFNGLEEFFATNELELSCAGIEAQKLAVFADPDEEYGYPVYFSIVTGEVMTVNSSKDVSWTGFLSSEGETNNVKTCIAVSFDKHSAQYDCEAFDIR